MDRNYSGSRHGLDTLELKRLAKYQIKVNDDTKNCHLHRILNTERHLFGHCKIIVRNLMKTANHLFCCIRILWLNYASMILFLGWP